MPKIKARKKGSAARTQTVQASSTTLSNNTAGTKRTAQASGMPGSQSLLMSALVSLGCWGLAVSFIFFSTDPNHYLFGGMAALMALMWSFSFGLRLRKVMRRK